MNKIALKKDAAGFSGELVIQKFKNGKMIWQSEPIRNKVVSSSPGYGRNLLMRQLSGDATYPIVINTARIGDGSTPPADSDTNLGNVLVTDIPLTDIAIANNVLTFQVFMADGDLPNDTYAEFGFFCTGRLFSRVLISPTYTKASGEDTLFVYTLTATG